MRARLFRRCMSFLEMHPSHLFSKVFVRIQLQVLLAATASAFQKKGRWILFSKDPLRAYGAFTLGCMEGKTDRLRLYRVSLALGRRIRRITGFKSQEDRQRLVFLLYRNIGITMTGSLPGEALVSSCFFSRIYSAKQCRCISAMDHGIIAGICGNGAFRFTERITEGCEACRLLFTRTSLQ